MRELARLSRISHPFLSEIERGGRNPSPQVLQRIADALGANLGDLRSRDTRSAIEDFRGLLRDYPELRQPFLNFVEALKGGRLKPLKAVKCLHSASSPR